MAAGDASAVPLRRSDEVLADLRDRLARADSCRTRRGARVRHDRRVSSELVTAWGELDWRARERWLNSHPQFLADIDGTTVHFAHLRAERDDAPALLVMHGWPHTFALQLDFADLLPDFHLVVASLPGFAFSARTRRPVRGAPRSDDARLMTGSVLGYVTYGEDVSANVIALSTTYPATTRSPASW